MLGLDIQYKKVASNNIIFAYTDTGKGKHTLLFLHGLGNSLIGFEKNLTALSTNNRCIGLDLPGNGFSSKDNYPYSIQFFADSVAAFIQEMKLENVVLIGHSMGGQIGILLTALYPSLVEKLVLIASAGLEKFSAMERMIMTSGMGILDMGMSDESKLRQALNSSFYSHKSGSQSLINAMVDMMDLQPTSHYKNMVDKCVKAMLNEPIFDKIASIQQRVLILFGTMDGMIPNKLFHLTSTSSMAEKATSLFKHGQLEMIPNAGHFVHWEKASEVNDAITQFIEN